ncbi:MAG: helix-turn-helix transcriptional regulator [Bacteroidales bacterium]|nr:helix-turn-helix transcriptional regulator [Bacteroidales bacterium]
MILEAWNTENKWLHFDDSIYLDDHCEKEELKVNVPGFSSSAMLIFMKGVLIMYAKHHSEASQTIRSRQDGNIAIMSFQLNGNFNVTEKNYEPYRIFQNDLHNTFYTNKRELVFEAPPIFENFRVVMSPAFFDQLLAKYHGRFSLYADMIKKGDYFNLYEMPLPISPRMKIIIRDILFHNVSDNLLSKVFYDTKITELFGCQLEQILSLKNDKRKIELSPTERKKIQEAQTLLLQNLSDYPSISTISRSVAINENKLKRGFKEVFGTSIYNYLLTIRISKAIELLENPGLNIDDIASQLGYTDSAHFSRAFRRIKGVPPGQYRREMFNQ